jgi:hypothetical protein
MHKLLFGNRLPPFHREVISGACVGPKRNAPCGIIDLREEPLDSGLASRSWLKLFAAEVLLVKLQIR